MDPFLFSVKTALILRFVTIIPYTLTPFVETWQDMKTEPRDVCGVDALFVEGNPTEGYLHRLLIY